MLPIDKSLTLNKINPSVNNNMFLKSLKNRLYFYYKQIK